MRANRSDENATDASVLKCRDDTEIKSKLLITRRKQNHTWLQKASRLLDARKGTLCDCDHVTVQMNNIMNICMTKQDFS